MILLIIILILQSIAGVLIARYGLKIHAMPLLIPVGIGIGNGGQILLLNILLRFLPTATAGWLALGILWALGGLAWWFAREAINPLTSYLSKQTGILLLIVWIGLTGITYNAQVTYTNVDESHHVPSAVMFAERGMPFSIRSESYMNEALCSYYHYADNMGVGVWHAQTGITNFETLFDWRVTTNAATIFGLIFALLWSLLGRKRSLFALLGIIIFFTISPATWLATVHQITETPDINLFAHTEILSGYISWENEQPKPLFHSTDLMVPLSFYMYAPHPIGFWIMGLLALLGLLHLKNHHWRWYIGLGILTASTALYHVSGMPLIAISIGLVLLYQAWQDRDRISHLIAFCATTFLVLGIQGGIVTDSLWCEPYADVNAPLFQSEGESITTFNVQFPPQYGGGLYTGTPSINMLAPSNWLSVLVDWGIGILLSPLLLGYAFYKRHMVIGAMAVTSILLIAYPFFFVNEVYSLDSFRITIFPIWLCGGLSVIMLNHLWETITKKWIAAIVILLMTLTMTLTGLVNLLWSASQPATDSLIMDTIDYTIAEEWRGEIDTVFDPSLELYNTLGNARAVVVFGAPIRDQITLNSAIGYQDSRLAPWRNNLFPGDLKTLGYNYLYVDDTFIQQLTWFQADALNNSDYYELVDFWEGRRLYRVIGDEQATTANTISEETLGLSQATYEEFLGFSPPYPADAVIFFPASTPQQDLIFEISSTIERSRSESESLFPLLWVVNNLNTNLEPNDNITTWRQTKQQQALIQAGITYLLTTTTWEAWLTEPEYTALYETQPIQTWTLQDQTYHLWEIPPLE